MATLNTVLAFSRAQAQTDSNGLTDANGIIFANEALLDFRRKMIAKGVDASQLQEAYMSATSGQGTYLYPTDMFWLKAIEVNLANADPQGYVTAQQVDVSNLPDMTSFSWVRQNQPAAQPLFDDRGDWFEVFPTPVAGMNLTNAFRIFYYLEPTEYTSTSDTITYPESLDYRILGYRIAANYYRSLGKFGEADSFDATYEQKVSDITGTLSRGSQQPIMAVPIQDTGWQY